MITPGSPWNPQAASAHSRTWQQVYAVKSPCSAARPTCSCRHHQVGQAYSAMNPNNGVLVVRDRERHFRSRRHRKSSSRFRGSAGSSWATTRPASSSRRCRGTARFLQAGPSKCRRTRRPASRVLDIYGPGSVATDAIELRAAGAGRPVPWRPHERQGSPGLRRRVGREALRGEGLQRGSEPLFQESRGYRGAQGQQLRTSKPYRNGRSMVARRTRRRGGRPR